MVKIKNYTFKNDSLITRALTHSSFSQENYERLEFLGDSILDFLVAKYFFNNTSFNEGMLTKMRSHFVSEENLSNVFDNIDVLNFVKLGKSCKQLTKSIKCDMFEAIIAAIFLDSNLEECEKFIVENVFTEKFDDVKLLDDKSMLQELAQAKKTTVQYNLLQQTGLSHNPTFVVEAVVGQIRATAQSGNKQIAEQLAAKKVLDILRKEE